MGACLITGNMTICNVFSGLTHFAGVRLRVMGYPTPPPPDTDPTAAISDFVSSYELEAKACRYFTVLIYARQK